MVLDDGTRVELTVSDRSGMARFTFPKGQRAGLLVNGAGSASADVHISFLPPVAREKDGEALSFGSEAFVGWNRDLGWLLRIADPLHAACGFCLSKQAGRRGRFGRMGSWLSMHRRRRASARRRGLILAMGRCRLSKVGLSYVSEEKARANLKSELAGLGF